MLTGLASDAASKRGGSQVARPTQHGTQLPLQQPAALISSTLKPKANPAPALACKHTPTTTYTHSTS